MILLPVFISILLSNPASAANMGANVYLKPSLTLAIPNSSVSIDLDPGTNAFGTEDISITVGTNNSNGYRLYVSTSDSSTRLVNTVDSSEYIDTLPSTGDNDCSSGCSESAFPVNYWGYKLDSGNYLPFASGTMVSSSNGPVNDNHTTMTIGAKVDYTKSSGTYLANLQFNVVPTVTVHYMQDFAEDPTLKDTLCVSGYPNLVTDSRDNKTYYIQRLKDGKCWMIQNLRLGEDLADVSGSMILTSADSNMSSDFVLTNKVLNGKMPAKQVVDSVVSGGYGYIYDGSAFYCTAGYGCYYNFYTSTAGVGKSEGEGAVLSGNVNADICPSGWSIPTGNESNINSEFHTLLNSYNASNPALLIVNPTTATENINGSYAPGFTLGGGYNGSGLEGAGTIGFYWSRSVKSISRSYELAARASSASHNSDTFKFLGRSVRCLLQE